MVLPDLGIANSTVLRILRVQDSSAKRLVLPAPSQAPPPQQQGPQAPPQHQAPQQQGPQAPPQHQVSQAPPQQQGSQAPPQQQGLQQQQQQQIQIPVWYSVAVSKQMAVPGRHRQLRITMIQ